MSYILIIQMRNENSTEQVEVLNKNKMSFCMVILQKDVLEIII